MRKPLLVLTIAALLASGAACAQQHAAGKAMRYKWVDGKGLTHFSDGLSQDAIKYGYDVVNDQGMVVRHVQRALTPAERAAAQQLARAQAAAKREAQARARADEQMLAAYPDEAAYKASLQEALKTLDQQIHTSKLNLRSQEQALTDLLARAAGYEHDKKPLPKSLADSIASQRGVVNDLHAVLLRQQTLRAQAAKDQLQQLAHYRALQQALQRNP